MQRANLPTLHIFLKEGMAAHGDKHVVRLEVSLGSALFISSFEMLELTVWTHLQGEPIPGQGQGATILM